LDQTQSLWLPRTAIEDLALKGLSISSDLTVRMHIMEMAFGAPVSRSAWYWARESFLYIPSESMVHFLQSSSEAKPLYLDDHLPAL
jgi:hypothetical protein